MKKMNGILIAAVTVVIVGMFLISPASAESMKIGYVDLRRAFYEYEKSKSFDEALTSLTNQRGEKRNEMVEEVRKMRDEGELLSDSAKAAKQKELDAKITVLSEYDSNTRQELLNKKNDMFREVIGDIQKIVEDIGARDKYTYIFDSRNIMYSQKSEDLTEQVLAKLNKK